MKYILVFKLVIMQTIFVQGWWECVHLFCFSLLQYLCIKSLRMDILGESDMKKNWEGDQEKVA